MNTHQRQRVDASNALGFRLLSELSDDPNQPNVFLSPFSIALALALAFNGADFQAKESLSTILGTATSSLDEINAAYAGLLVELDGLAPAVSLTVANSIWVKTGLQPSPELVERLAEHYGGELASVDFSKPTEAVGIINHWVAENTRGKIQKLLNTDHVVDAVQILVNAIAFKGLWTHPFDEAETSTRPFTCADGQSKPVPMMTGSATWLYGESECFEWVFLPYGDRHENPRCVMQVLLPKPELSFDEAREALTLERWQQWTQSASGQPGEVVLPRFTARFQADLGDALVKLGGPGLLGRGFPGMGLGDLVISSVVHEAVLEVNEEGAEAAAATAMVISLGAPPFHMVVDRPFFCSISDMPTRLALFMGWIADPTR